ncbi:unnamed protein product [Owenia fusiformis]|uniref:Uncharacterized protein n=1 Tax=Owenia fusiformis TaxID=6347 RepID=A0A8J1TB86_OWEFU|nr:unnamed protein product [Owenia fusiformis]
MDVTYMKAVRLIQPGGLLKLETIPKPTVQSPYDVIVKVSNCGVCGSDLHFVAGNQESSAVTVTLGHEFSGIVHETGSDVINVKVGDRVGVNPNGGCKRCDFCLRGRENMCDTGGCRSSVGVFRDGGFAEYSRIPCDYVFCLADETPLEVGVLCEPLSCIMRGADHFGAIQDDARILVQGCGITGLLFITLFHHRGFRNISACEVSATRRKVVEDLDLGIKVYTPDELLAEYPEKESAIRGFDIVADCTGAPRAIEAGYKILRRAGKMCIFGVCPPDATINIKPVDFMTKELSLLGCNINNYTYPKAVACAHNMGDKYLSFEKLGVKRFKLEDFQDAFDELKAGTIAKAVFSISQ